MCANVKKNDISARLLEKNSVGSQWWMLDCRDVSECVSGGETGVDVDEVCSHAARGGPCIALTLSFYSHSCDKSWIEKSLTICLRSDRAVTESLNIPCIITALSLILETVWNVSASRNILYSKCCFLPFTNWGLDGKTFTVAFHEKMGGKILVQND